MEKHIKRAVENDINNDYEFDSYEEGSFHSQDSGTSEGKRRKLTSMHYEPTSKKVHF